MKRPADQRTHDPAAVESDPVWDLLAQSPPPKAGPMFARDVARAVRLEAEAGSAGWLGRSWAALVRRPVRNFGAVAAAAALAVFLAWPGAENSSDSGGIAQFPEETAVPSEAADAFSELEDVAAGELLADADLSAFSDDELLVLLGF